MKNLSECERCGSYHGTLYAMCGERRGKVVEIVTGAEEHPIGTRRFAEMHRLWSAGEDYSTVMIAEIKVNYSYSYVLCRCASMGAYNCPVHATATIAADDAKPRVGPDDSAHRSIHDAIGHILSGKVTAPARAAVRKALDTAEAPLQGRAKSDEAMGRVLRLK